MDDLRVRQWLQDRMEAHAKSLLTEPQEQLRILTRLTDAVVFEEFIQKRLPGAKSFSLEGAESLIPLLELAIEKAGEQGIDEIVLAMAHRGRLNVLANIMGKSPREIFREFADLDPELHIGRGDVKYHLGYTTDWMTAARAQVHLSLCFNPSHLEFVNPVAMGRMRAKQDRAGDDDRHRGMVIVDSRRCGICGRRHHAGNAQLESARRLQSRRHVAHRRQQPDRFHHHRRAKAARARMPPTSPRCCKCRSSTSTARIPKPWHKCVRLAMDFRREVQARRR